MIRIILLATLWWCCFEEKILESSSNFAICSDCTCCSDTVIVRDVIVERENPFCVSTSSNSRVCIEAVDVFTSVIRFSYEHEENDTLAAVIETAHPCLNDKVSHVYTFVILSNVNEIIIEMDGYFIEHIELPDDVVVDIRLMQRQASSLNLELEDYNDDISEFDMIEFISDKILYSKLNRLPFHIEMRRVCGYEGDSILSWTPFKYYENDQVGLQATFVKKIMENLQSKNKQFNLNVQLSLNDYVAAIDIAFDMIDGIMGPTYFRDIWDMMRCMIIKMKW